LLNSGARNDDFVQLFGINPNKAEILRKTCKKYFAQSNIKSYEKFTNVDLTIILQLSGLTIEDLGYKASTPVFSGAKLNDIAATLKEADLDPAKDKGKTQLYDGQTGQPFDATITVGVMYMLKLDHMVDDKIHARSIGPYSKVNQQPLGGRSQNGGQRFGEMEVWALEAYGAAYNLREILTVKSDDTVGRNYTYNAIVRGRKLPVPSLPESFKLLTKQLQGLCLSMTVIDQDGTKHDMNDYAITSSIEEDIKNIEKEADEIETVETFDQGEYNL
jgi:DNA-directed RNA polymerase subunit beta